ncbi:MAG: lysozyme family protein [Adlercreutzia equolifaciens]
MESTVDDGRDTSSEAGSDMLVGGASTVARRAARRPGRAGSGQGPAGPRPRRGCPAIPRARPAARPAAGAARRPRLGLRPPPRSAAPAWRPALRRRELRQGKAAAGAGRAAAANAGKAAAVGAGKGLAAAAAAVGAPTVALAMAMLAALALCGLVLCMCGAGASSTQARAVGLSEEVQALRPYVSYYMHQEGKGEFVELALAVCQHESGGAGWKIADHDPFQCAESTGASRPGFPDAGTVADPVTGADGDDWWCSASVKQGCAYLSDKLRLWGCDDPCDLEALKNVLQTYNSGPGWHAYALSNGGRWSEDLARSYGIGTPNYPVRVLEHYEVSYGASGDGAAVAEWVKARENKWLVYSGCEPAWIPRTGATDCSGMCRAAYLAVTGMDIGWYTGDQSLGGKEIASGSRGQGVSASQLEPGDLVFCNFNGYNPTWDHVEMYVGDGQLMGMGHAPGPHYSGDVSSYVANTYNWQVRRYL